MLQREVPLQVGCRLPLPCLASPAAQPPLPALTSPPGVCGCCVLPPAGGRGVLSPLSFHLTLSSPTPASLLPCISECGLRLRDAAAQRNPLIASLIHLGLAQLDKTLTQENKTGEYGSICTALTQLPSSDCKIPYCLDGPWICCLDEPWVKSKVDDKPHVAHETSVKSLVPALFLHIIFTGWLVFVP